MVTVEILQTVMTNLQAQAHHKMVTLHGRAEGYRQLEYTQRFERRYDATTSSSGEEYQGVGQEVIHFGNRLRAILRSCAEEDPVNICCSVADGNGLKAMRLLMMRYEPRTPGTKRALLKAVINNL